MIHESMRYAISVCPGCDGVVRKKLNIFDFAKGAAISCDCGAVVWEAREAKDKYRITVNCPACEDYHTYTMSKRNFWGKKYFAFNCTNWDVGVLYVGEDKEFLEKQLSAQNSSIHEMFSDFLEENDSFEDMYELIECINDIARADNVKCGCEEKDITMIIDGDKVILACKSCGKTKSIFPTEENIDLLYETGTIVLDDTTLN